VSSVRVAVTQSYLSRGGTRGSRVAEVGNHARQELVFREESAKCGFVCLFHRHLEQPVELAVVYVVVAAVDESTRTGTSKKEAKRYWYSRGAGKGIGGGIGTCTHTQQQQQQQRLPVLKHPIRCNSPEIRWNVVHHLWYA
jgi:hypothetical protein